MFSNTELASLLDTTCKDDDECKKALNDTRQQKFAKASFETQASTFIVLIERLMVEMEDAYERMQQNNSECLTKMAELCGMYRSRHIFRSYLDLS